MTDGIHESSIFINQGLDGIVEKNFGGEHLRKKIENLSAITLILPEETAEIPGIYYSILKMLAFEGINFVEAVSSYTELTIFVDDKNVDRAFAVLKRLSN